MVQLVFVHGVSVRDDGADYAAAVSKRHQLFLNYAFKDNPVTFYDPYWGDLGAVPKHGYASIPKDNATALGIGGHLGGGIAGGAAGAVDISQSQQLVQAAKDDWLALIHSLSLTLDDAKPGEAALAEGLVRYALSQPEDATGNAQPPTWLATLGNDDELLQRLETEATAQIAGTTTLGIGSALKNAGQKILGGASNLVNGPLASGLRALTPKIGYFIGDVFTYLKDGTGRTGIRARVTNQLITAAQLAQQNSEPLILMGHSMGGVILYDMLSDPVYLADVGAQLGFPLTVDLYISIGSQPSLFEEFSLFESSATAAGVKAPRPPSVQRWWNIFDRIDVLSFAAEGVFDDVVDLQADTLAWLGSAHGAYLRSQVVHQKLHKRLRDENLIA